MQIYRVKPCRPSFVEVSVPASKSILNRALPLAAFTEGDIRLSCGALAEDTRAMLSCLSALGIRIREEDGGLFVCGKANIPVQGAVLDVQSAGTVARFLTAILALRGGNYELHASGQMSRRPMQLLPALEAAGVQIEYLGEEGAFPFRMHSEGLSQKIFQIEAQSSTQYASGLMLAAAAGQRELTVRLAGGGTRHSYIDMTADVIEDFGGTCARRPGEYHVSPIRNKPTEYAVDADVSSACYFFAMALLLGCDVSVRGLYREKRGKKLHFGDYAFLDLLEGMGIRFEQTQTGTVARGGSGKFAGFDVNVSEFSDQTLTLAALAPFAETPTRLRGIAHIRRQECDRVHAILYNLSRLGVPCSATEDEIIIRPALIEPCTVKTFGDHRVAMAFALTGLRTGGIVIEDPLCCRKTFENYFDLLDELTD